MLDGASSVNATTDATEPPTAPDIAGPHSPEGPDADGLDSPEPGLAL
jgi:hypothetical protein